MVMTLILLTVMAVSTAVAVRLSLTTDMVGANLRARTLAFQAAEAALRYCEEKVTSEFTSLPMLVNYQKDEEWLDEWLPGPAGQAGSAPRAARPARQHQEEPPVPVPVPDH